MIPSRSLLLKCLESHGAAPAARCHTSAVAERSFGDSPNPNHQWCHIEVMEKFIQIYVTYIYHYLPTFGWWGNMLVNIPEPWSIWVSLTCCISLLWTTCRAGKCTKDGWCVSAPGLAWQLQTQLGDIGMGPQLPLPSMVMVYFCLHNMRQYFPGKCCEIP